MGTPVITKKSENPRKVIFNISWTATAANETINATRAIDVGALEPDTIPNEGALCSGLKLVYAKGSTNLPNGLALFLLKDDNTILSTFTNDNPERVFKQYSESTASGASSVSAANAGDLKIAIGQSLTKSSGATTGNGAVVGTSLDVDIKCIKQYN